MLPELAVVINNIQRSNLKKDKELVCLAVQEYYKTLAKVCAVKEATPKSVPAKKKPLAHMKKIELIGKCNELGCDISEEMTNAQLIDKIKEKQ